MTEICELSDIELDAVCGGSLFSGPVVSFGGPLVSITNSFNPIIAVQTIVQTGLIVGLGSIAQDAGNALSASLRHI